VDLKAYKCASHLHFAMIYAGECRREMNQDGNVAFGKEDSTQFHNMYYPNEVTEKNFIYHDHCTFISFSLFQESDHHLWWSVWAIAGAERSNLPYLFFVVFAPVLYTVWHWLLWPKNVQNHFIICVPTVHTRARTLIDVVALKRKLSHLLPGLWILIVFND